LADKTLRPNESFLRLLKDIGALSAGTYAVVLAPVGFKADNTPVLLPITDGGLLSVAADTELPAAAALADALANPTTPIAGAGELLFNGTTWDRKRNNLAGVLLASEARTTTQTTADQTNYNGRGIHVILDVTAITDTPSIVLKIEGKSASGIYYTLLEGAAVTGVSKNIYKVMPWAANVANVSAADLLPRTWRIVITHSDADSITYSLDYAIDC
jgi:hypothetical protein